MQAQGEHKVKNWMKAKGDHWAWAHVDKNVLKVCSQVERVYCVSSGGRKPKKAEGYHLARVHLDKMVLIMVRQGGWSAGAMAKDTQRESP